jgi:hypothetical protein
MNALLRMFLFSTVVGLLLVALRPAPAGADDYWNGYWGWYDNTYRPYYYRQYSYGPAYGYPPPAYGYYGPSYYNYGPYGYYGAPRAGVSVYPGGAAVRVGPMRFGWR